MAKPTTWGTTKSGRPALFIALGAGIAISAILAALAAQFRHENQLLFGLVFFAALSIPFSLAVWVVIVDRSTLKGAVRNPEKSIEQQWYQNAATTAFHATLITGGALSFIFALFSNSQAGIYMMIPVVAGMLTFAIAYQFNKQS